MRQIIIKSVIILLFLFILVTNGQEDCGKYEKEEAYPWDIGLILNKTLHCLGTLITPVYVLTAAHCVKDFAKNTTFNDTLFYLRIYANKEPIKVDKIILNPSFDKVTLNSDLAILKLKPPAFKLYPICIDWTHKVDIDENALIQPVYNGNGAVYNLPQFPISFELCFTFIPDNFTTLMTPDKKCLESASQRFSQDEGGSIVYRNPDNQLHYAIGIVSRHEPTQRKVTIYTPIKNYVKWISPVLT